MADRLLVDALAKADFEVYEEYRLDERWDDQPEDKWWRDHAAEVLGRILADPRTAEALARALHGWHNPGAEYPVPDYCRIEAGALLRIMTRQLAE